MQKLINSNKNEYLNLYPFPFWASSSPNNSFIFTLIQQPFPPPWRNSRPTSSDWPPNSTAQPPWMNDLKDASFGRTSLADLGPHQKPKAKRNKFSMLYATLASMSSILLRYGEITLPYGKLTHLSFNHFVKFFDLKQILLWWTELRFTSKTISSFCWKRFGCFFYLLVSDEYQITDMILHLYQIQILCFGMILWILFYLVSIVLNMVSWIFFLLTTYLY